MQGALEQGAFVSPEPAGQEVQTPREARIPAPPPSLKLHPQDPLDPFPSDGLTGFSARPALSCPLAAPIWACPGGGAGSLDTPKPEAVPVGRGLGWRSSHHCLCSPKCARRLPAKRGLCCCLPPAACWLADGCLHSQSAALLPAVLVSSPGAGTAPKWGHKKCLTGPGAEPSTQWVCSKYGL